ncbi:MAG: ribonuclease G [Rhodanobacteraceae bacterium]
MSDEILFNVAPRESRVAIVENGVAQEVMIERAERRGQVGNIYKGRVTRVLPGMQAAFVDIGLQRSAFLHAGDLSRPALEDGEPGEQAMETRPINRLLHEGQQIVVQVIKDPIGSKGARITTSLSLPSRYLVLLPDHHVHGVSARITDMAERDRLRQILLAMDPDSEHGYIVRTNGEGQEHETLAEDVRFLGKLWKHLQKTIRQAAVGECVYEEPGLALRVLRDMLRENVVRVRVDDAASTDAMCRFATRFMPELAGRIEHYDGERPIFDFYGVEDELQRALQQQVALKSGGSLVIETTESMSTIDVNSGSYVSRRNLEETVFRTNLEAAQALARQLRLRNLGGIIIIDFIDMHDEDHKRQVLRTLEKALALDHVKTSVYAISELGLVQMTRKRTTESLARQLCETCPACSGRGYRKSVETVGLEVYREISRAVRQFEAERLLVLAHPAVVDWIVDEDSLALADLEAAIGKPIALQSEDQYPQEQFDVVLL